MYTRYARVLTADGSPLGVREALALINEILDETLTGAGAELDAETRWALTWFDEYGFDDGPFGRAEQLSKARNTSVAGLATAGIVATTGGPWSACAVATNSTPPGNPQPAGASPSGRPRSTC